MACESDAIAYITSARRGKTGGIRLRSGRRKNGRETLMSANFPEGRRVLVIEDEAMIAMMLEDMLVDLGYFVVAVVSTPAHALDIISAKMLDAAVLDVNLGGATSFQVAEALRKRKIPFVFSTGYGPGGIDGEYAAAPVLQKPFTQSELGSKLAELLN